MFNTVSMTATGLIGLVLTWGLGRLGVTASADSIQGLAVGLVQFASLILTFWGQVRRQDLSMGIFRK